MAVATESDIDLRYWLANEDWYMSRYTREWLDRTPANEAADTLAKIAEDAVAEPRAPWAVVATIVASAGLATSDGIGGKGPGARKAGTRAALMLADRNDPRCIPPLVRVFSTGGFLQSKYQAQIEEALSKFLTRTDEWPEIAPFASEIRTLAERIWQSNERQDLSAGHANLLISAIRCLHVLGSAENLAVLNAIFESSAGSAAKQPQRARIREHIGNLLNHE